MPRAAFLGDARMPGESVRDRIANLSTRGRVVAAACVVVLVLGGLSVFERVHYGVRPGQRYPDQLHYCGRTYSREGDSRTLLNPERTYPAFRFSAPLTASRDVRAQLPRGAHVGDSVTCTELLYIPTGGNLYLVYGLDGSAG